MKYLSLLAGIVGVLMMAAFAQAFDVTVSWDTSVHAEGYRLSTSIDNGASWQPATISSAIIGDVAPDVTETVITVRDIGVTLIRIESFNFIGPAIGTTKGVWVNPAWKLAAIPGGLHTVDN